MYIINIQIYLIRGMTVSNKGFGAGYPEYLLDLLTHAEPKENFLADGAINKSGSQASS